MIYREFRPIGEPYEAGRWFDKEGLRCTLVVDTWADNVNKTGLGLHLTARKSEDSRPAFEIRLQLPYESRLWCDAFTKDCPNGARPFSWSEVRQTFVEACKQAIFYRSVTGPGIVCVEPEKRQTNLLDLDWRATDEYGKGVSNPLVFLPKATWQNDMVACAEKLVLRHLGPLELHAQSLDEIANSTYAPPVLAARAIRNLLEKRQLREITGSAHADARRYELTVEGKTRLEESDATDGQSKHFGF